MSVSAADAPWLALYPEGAQAEIVADHTSMLDVFQAAVASSPDRPAIVYFDVELSFRELDVRSDALACALIEAGFGPGDRLAIYTQNDPAFVVGLLAAWKAAGCAVLVNPMNRAREVGYLLGDSGARAVLCLDELYDVVREVLESGRTQVQQVVVASARDDQHRDDPRVLTAVPDDLGDGVQRLSDLAARHRGDRPPAVTPDPDTVAVLTYTSGTTGEPKGALNTHRALAFNAQTYREWMALGPDDVILGIAPLFHITGLVGHACTGMLLGARLVLLHRFEPHVVLDAIREHRPTFTVGAITAFNSLASLADVSPRDFESLRVVYSGGAPIAPALRDSIRERTGLVIHNIYGMTETNSPAIGVPLGAEAPIDPLTGALSIGIPTFNTTATVVDDSGAELPVGQIGEIVVAGPQVVPGYWNKPEQTAEKIRDGAIHTGDVGMMDAEGWFYLVDRKTDMIIASGYKVWPREVEDVLLTHPSVREAAVVGVPDSYRGETVKAIVSLKAGGQATPEELVAHCKERLAAYKYPRLVEIVADVPKTPTGKILRRQLR